MCGKVAGLARPVKSAAQYKIPGDTNRKVGRLKN